MGRKSRACVRRVSCSSPVHAHARERSRPQVCRGPARDRARQRAPSRVVLHHDLLSLSRLSTREELAVAGAAFGPRCRRSEGALDRRSEEAVRLSHAALPRSASLAKAASVHRSMDAPHAFLYRTDSSCSLPRRSFPRARTERTHPDDSFHPLIRLHLLLVLHITILSCAGAGRCGFPRSRRRTRADSCVLLFRTGMCSA
jgi:hypothetical protein